MKRKEKNDLLKRNAEAIDRLLTKHGESLPKELASELVGLAREIDRGMYITKPRDFEALIKDGRIDIDEEVVK